MSSTTTSTGPAARIARLVGATVLAAAFALGAAATPADAANSLRVKPSHANSLVAGSQANSL